MNEYEEKIGEVNLALQNTKNKFKIETRGNGLWFEENECTHGMSLSNPEIKHLNHILPTTTTNTATIVYLPHFSSVFLQAIIKNNNNYLEKRHITPTFGKISINITYLDINNQKHEKKLLLSSTFMSSKYNGTNKESEVILKYLIEHQG